MSLCIVFVLKVLILIEALSLGLWCLYCITSWTVVGFLPPATKLGQGNIFRSVCQQFCPQGGCAWLLGGACMVLFGEVHGFIGGVCGFIGGHAWFYLGGMRGFIWGVCMVLFGGAYMVSFGGACVVLFGGCMVLFRGGMRGFFSFFGYNEIRSMSGRYASYWNAFL